MKQLGLLAVAMAMLGAAAPPSVPHEDVGPLSTDRHVHGVITSVESAKVTIASTQKSVTGKIDPARTKVTINGKAARVADLQVTAHAKAELCLDDVWLSIDAH